MSSTSIIKSSFLVITFLSLIALKLSNNIVQAIENDADGINIQDLNLEQGADDGYDQKDETNLNQKERSYISPKLKSDNFFLFENFDDDLKFKVDWIQSKDSKYEGKWALDSGPDRPKADKQLLLPLKARHYAISSKLNKPFLFSDEKPLVIQYEVQFRENLDCGGAYVKLLRQSAINDLSKLTDKTPFTIMFGPDKCGTESKLHFIIQYLNPKTQEYEEKHWKQAKLVTNLMSIFNDKRHHLLKLVLEANNNFEIFLDDISVGKGNLLEELEPAINPPKEIVDSNDIRPLDWDDRPQIDDPNAKKPDDWDENEPKTIEDPDAQKPSDWLENEPKYIHDPEAKKPDDWEDMDGEWEAPLIENPSCAQVSGCGEWKAPMISNPNYKGKWRAPKIDNPNYKGKWSPRMIPNPDYFFDENPFKSLEPIGAISFELWSMTDNVAFDNLIITNDNELTNLLKFLTWQEKKDEADASSTSFLVRSMHSLKTQPWLWAVLVIAIALPLFLFISYCCDSKSSKSSDKSGSKTNAKNNKTEDESLLEEKEKEVEQEDEVNDEQEDLEGEEEDEGEEDDEEEEEGEETKLAGDKVSKMQVRRRKKN